jgi:hypothetical protein
MNILREWIPHKKGVIKSVLGLKDLARQPDGKTDSVRRYTQDKIHGGILMLKNSFATIIKNRRTIKCEGKNDA